MKKNVGLLESFLRMFVGFFLFGKGLKRSNTPLLLFASMQLAAGSTRFCVVYQLLGISTYKQQHPIGVITDKVKDIF